MATERERRLAETATRKPIEVTLNPIKAPTIVVQLDPSGQARPYFSAPMSLNKRDYTDTAENGVLLVASTAMAAGIETTADALQYSLGGSDYGAAPNILLAGIQLLAFSVLKLLALWLRSGGAAMLSTFMSLFRGRR